MSICKRVAVLAALFVFTASALLAQQQSAPVVNVRTNPSGCTVVLSGDINVAGVTPTSFTQNLRGFYSVVAYRNGYETHHSSVLLSGIGSTDLELTLTPKTRVKAGLRSLVIPGWGQMYSGSKTKGVMITIGTAAAAVTLGILHLDYDGKRDDYNEMKARYDATRDVSKREAMLDELYQAQKRANDAEKTRLVGAAVLAGIWAWNVIDAAVFFPDFGIQISGSELTIRPNVTPEGVQLVGVLSF